jgi:formylglycine-generating enzyme required for sulfatase activity
MVRDDFWLAVSRFLKEVEVEIVQSRNIALVDLFDIDHAKKVLAAFGRAFGKLPGKSGEISKEQREFLKQAVSSLSLENKVICVRLALFAEMMKSRSWTPTTLREFGSVGVTFLDATFSSQTANPKYRLHQKAARAVLKALLPETGTNIKGHMRSYAELLEASGYASRPREFDELIRILDSELRLITPTDPEGEEADAESKSPAEPGQKYYQLTHDYLVHSLRDWLTRKQKETRRGRAELLLADRASVWNARPENRQLLSLPQLVSIQLLTQKKNWSRPQRRMMRKAGRYHMLRGLALSLLIVAVTLAGLGIRNQVIEQRRADHAASLVRQLLNADIAQVPGIITEMHDHRALVDPLLKEQNNQAANDSPQKLHTSLALLPVDPEQLGYLYERLLNSGPTELVVIRDALMGHRDELVERLWKVLGNAKEDSDRRFRAACVLATYDPGGDGWQNASKFVTDHLLTVVKKNPSHYSPLLEMLRPVRQRLIGSLAEVYRNREQPESERAFATTILADYASNQPSILADLLLDADDKQFAVIYPNVAANRERTVAILEGTINTPLASKKTEEEKERLAKRQANAAVALLKMGQPEQVWPVLKHSPDPRVRSYLIHRLGPMDADFRDLVRRFEEEPDLTIRRALLLSWGQFGEEAWPSGERVLAVERLREVYRNDPDPGLHGAAEWLLRQWKQEQWLTQTDEALAKSRPHRLKAIFQTLMREKGHATPQWYMNGQGQTMVVIPGPVEFLMGSPSTEAGRSSNEQLHRQRIGRTFALAVKPVTIARFQRFIKDPGKTNNQFAPSGDCAAGGTNWYEAAAYCNWLSEQEGVPKEQWCYETNREGLVTRLKEHYLDLVGYRLPTEAEWEHACRAGAVTSRYYGESDELLGNYGWYASNSANRSWPVGMLKPNDFGLFDMHGNVWVWCQDRFADYKKSDEGSAIEDTEDTSLINDKEGRVARGGSFIYPSWMARSACRNTYVPTVYLYNVGFRPARTLRP